MQINSRTEKQLEQLNLGHTGIGKQILLGGKFNESKLHIAVLN